MISMNMVLGLDESYEVAERTEVPAAAGGSFRGTL